jgi:hypothetical protein
VSLLLARIARAPLLDEAQLLRVGEHFARLLLLARHAGAFESGFVGFLQFSTILWRYVQPYRSLKFFQFA